MQVKKDVLKIVGPKLPKGLECLSTFDQRIEDEDQIANMELVDCIIERQVAEKVSFKHVVFRNVTFSDVSFDSADIEDVLFENCDLSNSFFRGSILNRVQMINCKLVGANFTDTSFINVEISRSNGQYASFRFSHCKRFRILDSIMPYVDFQSVDFNEMFFEKTELQGGQFSGTKLNGIDFSTCDITNIGVGLEEIRGASVSSLQAVGLSGLLGISIKDAF